MRKFEFRLETVLKYRRAIEDEAKQAYLAARSEIVGAEGVALAILNERKELLRVHLQTVEDRLCAERLHGAIDDRHIQQLRIIDLLEDEAERRRQEWIERRKDAVAIEKLRQRAHDEWQYESKREEQSQMDEFATQRFGR